MDRNGRGVGHAPARPVLYAVARVRPSGRFTYMTPRWPDARGHLVGLLNQHATGAAAAAAVEVARRARAAAHQVPTAPPASTWSVQLGECRYELARQHVRPVPAAHSAVEACPAAAAAASGGRHCHPSSSGWAAARNATWRD